MTNKELTTKENNSSLLELYSSSCEAVSEKKRYIQFGTPHKKKVKSNQDLLNRFFVADSGEVVSVPLESDKDNSCFQAVPFYFFEDIILEIMPVKEGAIHYLDKLYCATIPLKVFTSPSFGGDFKGVKIDNPFATREAKNSEARIPRTKEIRLKPKSVSTLVLKLFRKGRLEGDTYCITENSLQRGEPLKNIYRRWVSVVKGGSPYSPLWIFSTSGVGRSGEVGSYYGLDSQVNDKAELSQSDVALLSGDTQAIEKERRGFIESCLQHYGKDYVSHSLANFERYFLKPTEGEAPAEVPKMGNVGPSRGMSEAPTAISEAKPKTKGKAKGVKNYAPPAGPSKSKTMGSGAKAEEVL